ncbi:hypothetical protein [Methylobacterium sp.]|uniref:hypothetical protein n=1 Tax=Methylobacterium sp. TaxID=409 RepID=UPI000C48CB3B|nr:hypothetical protein [Methylobacterium sp.]MBP32407.1 hypothetical protein [Methylobacterium sp.]
MDHIQAEVERFLSDSRKRMYGQLLAVVKSSCVEIKDRLGSNVVSRIYGRDDKQQGAIFKSSVKIAAKVRAKRAKDPDFVPKSVTDVIGMTAVVQYPDQVQPFIAAVSEALAKRNVRAEKVERVEKPGYFATHVDLLSLDVAHDGIWCELQVKTMLHDAWSAKMHDLNYKPSGQIDPRLDSMMRVIANSLEAIEVQSETLRDLITEHWRIEDSWRRAARHKLFEMMPAWLATSGSSPEATALRTDLVAARSDIEVAGPGSPVLAGFVERITRLKEASQRQGWTMAAYLGSLRSDDVHTDFALRSVEDWVGEWPRYARTAMAAGAPIPEQELWSAPLACYAIGDMDRAIEYSRTLLTAQEMPLSAHGLAVVRINLANFLIEKEYFLPTKSAEERQALRAQIEEVIASCPDLEQEDPSPFHDLRGMLMVTFAAQAAEIQEAIKLIERGRDEAPDHEKQVAIAYYELHARLAWRRLLEVENAILR